MKSSSLDTTIGRWTALGASFNAKPTQGAVDLERLILDTARHASEMARLFTMAATWLHTYGDCVAKHRLKRLIRHEFEPEYHATLGLLLETAQAGTHPPEFASVLTLLQPAPEPEPLFESSKRTTQLRDIAEQRASPLSHKWRRWAQPIEFKKDALRSSSWVMKRHPWLRSHADFRGDLRASVMASLRYDPGAGDSESQLARLAGGSRAQVRSAIRNLELTGRVDARMSTQNRRTITLTDAA